MGRKCVPEGVLVAAGQMQMLTMMVATAQFQGRWLAMAGKK